MKGFYTTIAVLVVAGLAFFGWKLTSRPVVSIPANVTVLPSDTAGFRGYLLGSDSAPVEITQYADYQCPGCANYDIVTFPDVRTRLIQTGKVRWRYRDFPLSSIHQYARLADHAAACADEQGKFWQMHTLLYEGQSDWAGGGAQAQFRKYAGIVGLDVKKYDECMESARYAGRIEASYQEGVALGVNGTPTFLIAGRLYNAMSYDQLKQLVDSLIAAKPAS
jgi:protein-disulfide isomerase